MATKTVDLGRHGNAKPAKAGGGYAEDQQRQLSEGGIQQAQNRRSALNGHQYDRVFSSRAFRAIETAVIVTGFPQAQIELLEKIGIPDPGMSGDGEVIDRLAKEFGNKAVQVWFEHPDGEALRRFGHEAAHVIMNELARNDHDEAVGFFGHGVLTPVTALSLVDLLACRDDLILANLLDLSLNEAGLIRLVVNDGNVKEVQIFNN